MTNYQITQNLQKYINYLRMVKSLQILTPISSFAHLNLIQDKFQAIIVKDLVHNK